MEGGDSLIEMRYRTTICNDCGLKPAKYFIVKGLGCFPDYTYTDSYVCISCKNKYDRLSAFGFEPQYILIFIEFTFNLIVILIYTESNNSLSSQPLLDILKISSINNIFYIA